MKKIFCIIVCLTGVSFASQAQEVIHINSREDALSLRSLQTIDNPEGALQSRMFDYNPRLRQLTAANQGDTVCLDFFTDKRYKSVIRRVSSDCNGILGITADIVDAPFAACFIAISDAGILLQADLSDRDEHFSVSMKDSRSVLSLHFPL
jgi:hypothetical protein